MKPNVIHTKNLIGDALALVQSAENEALAKRSHFRIGLSGGNTPRPVHQALTQMEMQWDKWFVTFGDERCVPPNDEQSNYRMVRETLFDLAPIPPENVLRMHGEDNPAEAAADYERELRSRADEENFYRHDLLFLGMGDDGHTASLFPGTAALHEMDKWVTANHVPKFDTNRITLTYPIINASRHVCFLVNSKGKGPILEMITSGQSDAPCTKVCPKDGTLTWLLGD